MRKSRIVAAGLAGTVAALMAGCGNNTQTADCVDASGRVLPDNYCQSYGGGYYGGGYYGGNGVVIVHSGGPHWVYGGNVTTSGGVSRVYGGSTTPSGSGDISSRSGTTVRGGFGGSGEGHGGFGHGGEGNNPCAECLACRETSWQLEVEALGLTWHTHSDGSPYWDESAYYVFSAAEVDESGAGDQRSASALPASGGACHCPEPVCGARHSPGGRSADSAFLAGQSAVSVRAVRSGL